MPSVGVDKIILSSDTALQTKYGAAGLASIQSAIASLVAADSARGIVTRYVALDHAPTMTGLGLSAVAPGSPDQDFKAAVDGVFNAFAPDYLALLGANDVVPHQRLTNSLFDPTDPRSDRDTEIPSDLPYACSQPAFSTDPGQFIGPTRVVGRIPDLEGGHDPTYLLDLINVAAGATPQPVMTYRNVFGVSADIWRASTQASIAAAFGSANGLQQSPTAGPFWTPAELGNLSHFINCHGAPADPHFYGEGATGVQPIAHDAAHLAANAHPGTVVAAECCYGAELYDPTIAGQMGIANTYLRRGAYGFFGSTNIAYGPAIGNTYADLICRYFFQHLLAGSSMGLAALQARQDYIANNSPLDAVSLKTLAQFVLLGDPSIHPVAGSDAEMAEPHSFAVASGPAVTDRAQRRRRAMTRGLDLARTTAVSAMETEGLPSAVVQSALDQVAANLGIASKTARRFRVRPPADPQLEAALPAAMKLRVPDASAFYVMMSALPDSGRAARSIALIAQEVNGTVGTVRAAYAKSAGSAALADAAAAVGHA